MAIVLDSSAVTFLSVRSTRAAALVAELRARGYWPPIVPTVVLVECLTGRPGPDANVNRFLKACDVVEEIPVHMARRAALLRTMARRGSAVDALVVACAEPEGTVLSSDVRDLGALTSRADAVNVIPV